MGSWAFLDIPNSYMAWRYVFRTQDTDNLDSIQLHNCYSIFFFFLPSSLPVLLLIRGVEKIQFVVILSFNPILSPYKCQKCVYTCGDFYQYNTITFSVKMNVYTLYLTCVDSLASVVAKVFVYLTKKILSITLKISLRWISLTSLFMSPFFILLRYLKVS